MVPNKVAHIYSRETVVDRYAGNSTYVVWLARELHKAGWKVTLFLLRGMSPNRRPWFRVRHAADEFATLVAPGHVRIGPYFVQLNFLQPWLAGPAVAVVKVFTEIVRSLGIPWPAWVNRYFSAPSWDLSPATAREIRYATDQVQKATPELVVANYAYLAPIFREQARGTFTSVIVMHDLLSRHADLLMRSGQCKMDPIDPEDELSWFRMADCVVAIQPGEAGIVRNAVKPTAVLVVPQGIQPIPSGAPARPGRCLFVASGAVANVDALRYLTEEIWPEVLLQVPWAELRVVGTIATRHLDSARRIDYAGRVEDLSAEYAAAQVVVVPIRFGTGLKIKLIEALAHGRPCVSTPSGADGVEAEARRAIVVADGATAFVDAVVRLLTNEEERDLLGARALKAAEACYGTEKCFGPLLQFLQARVPTTREGSSVPAGVR